MVGVGGLMRFAAAGEPGSKEFFDSDHVIQLLPGEVKLSGTCRAVDLRDSIEGSPICPSLVLQRSVEVHSCDDREA